MNLSDCKNAHVSDYFTKRVFLESNLHRVDLRVLLIKFAILCTAHFDDVLIILCVKGALLSREITFIQTAPKILNCVIVFFITLKIL